MKGGREIEKEDTGTWDKKQKKREGEKYCNMIHAMLEQPMETRLKGS